ncbi:methyl-accepting chemotaxis protein [Chitinimonas taiwanensis]|uniref:Methyl-accepting chemotaxis protein n=1 Tax=Chitinimonas taiwanensis DSM 18899 TaxID=1121279 RepID=A0A1K2HN76_9NEIS|nr:methyl-accepting chemotaxis protein [Chitinimonas taiwanensis]SFZ78017.1 methyl-accepting chemotaxis protein [Chitinimonas taiwanensis DSM 18899]
MTSLFSNWQLRTKVLVAAALAIVVGFAVMIWVIAGGVYRDAEAVGLARANEQADAYAKRVEDEFALGFALPRHLADAVLGMQGGQLPDRKTLDKMIMRLLGGFPQASGLWMLMEPNALDGKDAEYASDWPIHDPSGRYMPYITQSDGKVVQDKMLGADQQAKAEPFRQDPANYKPEYEQAGWGDFYFVPKQRQQDTVTEPYAYEVQGKKVLMSSLAVAIKDGGGKWLGVAAVDLPLGNLQANFSQYKPFGTGYLTLVSNGGLYVVNQDEKLLGQPLDKASVPADLMSQLLAGKPVQYEADDTLHVWRPIKLGNTGQNWGLGVSIPHATIVADALAARNQAVAIGVVAAVLILVLIGVLLTVLTRPLARLAQAMETLASGEGDLTRRLEVGANDEIGRTGKAFNQLMGQLREMFVQVRAQSESVGGAAERLSNSADIVEQASNHQAEAATATAASVEQVTVSIQHIADSARDFKHSAQETGSATARGQSLVDEVAAEIDKVNRSVDALATTMDNLGHQSAKVDTIVNVIKDIADQTNLLALNAAIEAARAGEQGRGFAVVADEVRKLAARTADATVEIGQIVAEIQREIGAAGGNMRDTREQIATGVQISHRASEAIGAVRGETERLVSDVAVIADSTREQAAASTDIAQNVERISSMAQTNSHAVAEVAHAVEELEGLSRSLGELVGRFKI